MLLQQPPAAAAGVAAASIAAGSAAAQSQLPQVVAYSAEKMRSLHALYRSHHCWSDQYTGRS